MFPCSDPGGRPGTLIVTVPIFEPPGQATPGIGLWILAWAGVQASSPWAADSFIVMPSGNVTLATFSCEESTCLGSGSWGRVSVVVKPSPSSDCVVSGCSELAGSNGGFTKDSSPLQPSVPIGVVYSAVAVTPS